MSIIAAGTTTTTALSSTGNTDGTIQLQVNGTTPSVTLNALGAVGVGASPNFGTSGQVLISGGSTAAPTWGTAGAATTATNLAGGAAGVVPYQTGSGATAFTAAGTTGQVLQSNGTSAPTWATPAAAFSAAADNTFTGTQTFSGTSAKLAIVLNDAAEVATVSATAATGTINYDITTQSVLFYTSNASANWTVNFRASSGTSLNTAMATGQSVSAAFLVTNGSTAYYNTTVQVDGTTITPRFQGGTAYSAGNANSIDVYTYTIIKTGSATFTVLASQTKFA